MNSELVNKEFIKKQKFELEEDIEKHDELNPVLFDENNNLKPEIKEKVLEIVDEFLREFEENEVELKVKDIILTGSNASYNYTKDSDLDIHIIVEPKEIAALVKYLISPEAKGITGQSINLCAGLTCGC